MCGRYMLTSPVEAIRQIFGVGGGLNLPARYNIAPGQQVPIIRGAKKGRELVNCELVRDRSVAEHERVGKSDVEGLVGEVDAEVDANEDDGSDGSKDHPCGKGRMASGSRRR